MRYLNLTLRFSSENDGTYEVQASASPAGEVVSSFEVPKAVREWMGHPTARGHKREAGITPVETQGQGPKPLAEHLGAALFSAVFTEPIRRILDQSLGHVRREPDLGLRIKLQVDPTAAGAQTLLGLPWEMLYRPESRRFLATDPRTPVVRHIRVPHPYETRDLPTRLRVLAIAADSGNRYGPLHLDKEEKRIREAAAGVTRVDVEFLRPRGWSEVEDALQDKTFHVVHFMGHGDFDPEGGRGFLLFPGSGTAAEEIADHRLAGVLALHPDLRLVFLNACHTARSPVESSLSGLTGVAAALVGKGVPAVIAMQAAIRDRAAILFSRMVYERLLSGESVDVAVACGRRLVQAREFSEIDWTLPVLFQRVSDGRIWRSRPRVLVVHADVDAVWARRVVRRLRSEESELDVQRFELDGSGTGSSPRRAARGTESTDVVVLVSRHSSVTLAESDELEDVLRRQRGQPQVLAGSRVLLPRSLAAGNVLRLSPLTDRETLGSDLARALTGRDKRQERPRPALFEWLWRRRAVVVAALIVILWYGLRVDTGAPAQVCSVLLTDPREEEVEWKELGNPSVPSRLVARVADVILANRPSALALDIQFRVTSHDDLEPLLKSLRGAEIPIVVPNLDFAKDPHESVKRALKALEGLPGTQVTGGAVDTVFASHLFGGFLLRSQLGQENRRPFFWELARVATPDMPLRIPRWASSVVVPFGASHHLGGLHLRSIRAQELVEDGGSVRKACIEASPVILGGLLTNDRDAEIEDRHRIPAPPWSDLATHEWSGAQVQAFLTAFAVSESLIWQAAWYWPLPYVLGACLLALKRRRSTGFIAAVIYLFIAPSVSLITGVVFPLWPVLFLGFFDTMQRRLTW